MFNIPRLANALSPLGFFIAYEAATGAWFVRANVTRPFFDVIDVNAGKQRGGKWGDIANAGISIALTPGPCTSPKGLGVAECLSDWSPTKTQEQAVAWERVIVDTAPAKLDGLARTHGEQLLDQTAETRAAVEKYLALLNRHLSVEEMIAKLSDGATEEELLEARRLSRTEGIICLPERACYDLISLLIARHAGKVENDPRDFWGQNPNTMPELNWRIQMLASRLYPELGWDLLRRA